MRRAELLARFDLDLAVDVAEVPRNRVSRHERLLRYLTVGHAVRGELRHPEFCGRERLNAGDRGSTGSSPGRRQLLTQLRLKARRTAAICEVETRSPDDAGHRLDDRRAEVLARARRERGQGEALPRCPPGRSIGIPERFECLVSGFGERSALQGETQRDWQLEQLGEAHLFLDQCVSTRSITGDVCDQPSERSPR